ncbi:hypothetical protein SHI21_18125 [Bacteriovorax sp. PP10]|uniref:Uncharacterized protein n=1 Tax=Bacteriovorax antarcticus TaxID=3088717 RepID=A0ABU5W001_9BACT|nr:hypothetical protein [Bacteriovorax sp. PP10]MEA9358157.1 hypothetical protein [Bacteriovorax sp. PP10]
MKHFVWAILAFSLMTTFKVETVSAKTESILAQIKISASDRTCRKDTDCRTVGVKCSCSCGKGVNKAHFAKYAQKLEQMCLANPPEKMCKVMCTGEAKCIDRVCTYVSK